jgi:hypothetical protein
MLSDPPVLIVLQEEGDPVVRLKAGLKEANGLDAWELGQGSATVPAGHGGSFLLPLER